MTSIVRYRKHITAYTIIEMHQPESESGERLTTELATLEDGFTYVAVPEGVVLPIQPEEITVEDVTLTEDLVDEIKRESPHVQLIHARTVEKIREQYSLNDEQKFTADLISNAFYEKTQTDSQKNKVDIYLQYRNECVSWGKSQKNLLGL